MEFLLLWWDNADDVLHALRHKLPSILSFLFALALFAATGFALVRSPQIMVAVLAVAASASLVEMFRRRVRAARATEK
jgi:uncharacterized membrane protein